MSLVQTLLGELNAARHDPALREHVNLLTARLAEFAPTPPPREPEYGARMRELHDLGYTIKEMAVAETIALGTAYNRCSTLGLQPNPPGMRAVREAEAREAALRRQLERGIYNSEVGFGVSSLTAAAGPIGGEPIPPEVELAEVRQAEVDRDLLPPEVDVTDEPVPSFEEFLAAQEGEGGR